MRNDAVSAKKITRDELKQITLEKIKMEFESEKRLAPYTPKSQQEQMQVVAIEKTKVMDQIYMKYGFKAVDLIRANEEMSVDDDNEIKMLKNMIMAEREKLTAEKKERHRQSLLFQGE